MSVIVCATPSEMAELYADWLIKMAKTTIKSRGIFTIALSGGSTPGLLFSVLGDRYYNSVPWECVHFFWGDERCVPPDDTESNFLLVKRMLLNKIVIPESNVHRIRGEEDPSSEIIRYSDEVSSIVPIKNKLPSFDLIMLGLGLDGHTASIFPGNSDLFNSTRICDLTIQPSNMTRRVTLTGGVINNARTITFLVTGSSKAETVKNIIERNASAAMLPAYYIEPVSGELKWFLDKDAAALL